MTLSSVLFLRVQDAVVIAQRYLPFAVAVRAIAVFEVSGLSGVRHSERGGTHGIHNFMTLTDGQTVCQSGFSIQETRP